MFFYMFMFIFILSGVFFNSVFFLKTNKIFESLSFIVLLDSFSLFFFLTLICVFFFVFIFSFYYQSQSFDFIRFIVMMLLFVISMILLIFHYNCFTLILGWDGLGITSYFLVAYYNNWSSINGSLVTMLMNRFGDFFIFWVLSFLIFSSISVFSKSFFIFFILMVGAFTKSAQIPFSSWLPLAMSAPTPISSLVHSSTLVTAGIYVLLKYFYIFNQTNSLSFLFFFGFITMVMASILGSFEVDGKKIVALSTLSQLGLMVLCLGINLPWASFFHLLGHSFFKSCMFIQVGVFIHSNFNSQDMRNLKENMLIKKFSSSSILICLISLMGFIFMTGFMSKEFILTTLSQTNNSFFYFFFIFSIMLTIIYSLRLISSLFSLIKTFSKKEEKMNSSFNSSTMLIVFSCCFSWNFYKNSNYFPLEFILSEKFFILFLFFCFLFSLKISKLFSKKKEFNNMILQDLFFKKLVWFNMKIYNSIDFEINFLKNSFINSILSFKLAKSSMKMIFTFFLTMTFILLFF